MNLKELKNKIILLFGKSRAFSDEEFLAQLKFHEITVVKEYTEEVVLIIDGKMMTPYEQNANDKLYKEKKHTFISIDVFEKELANSLDTDTLLMSLKLSHDKERLKDFLTNSMINNDLYLRLLKMYSWGGEDFFDNDDNRDVSAALIVRFYKNIERNHNVEYAALGLMHLVSQTSDEKLIEAVSFLEPVIKNPKVLSAIATNYATPKNVLNMLVKKSNPYIRTLIAMREDCDEEMQITLLKTSDEEVLEALSYNSSLAKEIVKKLLFNKQHAQNMAKHIRLDSELFELFLKNYSDKLAKNESLTYEMQERLVSSHNQKVMISLATNEHIDAKVAVELLCEDSQEIKFALYENSATPKKSLEEAYDSVLNHFALANNENTPSHILKLLGESEDIKVLRSLAKNISTPIEVLYQLQLDLRLERLVKENSAFGKHIMSENIGWQV